MKNFLMIYEQNVNDDIAHHTSSLRISYGSQKFCCFICYKIIKYMYNRRKAMEEYGMMKKFIYVLLPLQILILILSPRFGWKMYSPEAVALPYGGTAYVDGKFHTLYKNENHKIDISYQSIFSKQFLVTVDGRDEYEMKVEIDGAIRDTTTDVLHYTGADIVWNDSCGIFWWRYILTIAMTVCSIALVKRANRLWVFPGILYAASILISLRIFF